jgi:fatty-acyl-CoA synthase
MSSTFGGSWLSYQAQRSPGTTAMRDLASGRRLSYAELDERVGRLAGVLQGSFAVGRGDRVALLSRGCSQAFEVMYACARIGAIFVPLNIRLSDAELTALVSDAEPAVLVGERELLSRAIAAGTPALSWEDGYEQALAASDAAEPVLLDADDPWVIIYTSGTTGQPKGVVVTHAGSAATMIAGLAGGGVSAASVCLTALPVWHVAGLNLFANPVLFAGGTVLVMGSFDPGHALTLLTAQDEPVTHFCGVPAHYQFMQAQPGFEATTLRRFFAGVGGSPVPAALVEAWGGRGVTLSTIYGISEAGSTVTISPLDGAAPLTPGDVGRPAWHLRCRVMSGGQPCPPGEPGELQVAGASVTPGYWRRPEATAQAIEDGWLHTGDIAVIGVDGRVRIVDRIKDMYISGGENVYPAEVEETLYRHPDVAEVAVVGVPDQRWGETGSAWVVLAPGSRTAPGDIRTWARARMAAFKVPRDIHVVDALPRNATGKVLKASLRSRAPGEETGAAT